MAGGPDHDWIVERLRPLVGLTARSAEQEENFRAWALFLDGVARERPTVVFFDDLHWADDGLLAFLDHIVQYDLGAPLLLLGACRPELFALHPDVPGYLGGATSGDAPVTRIDLASLSICETERLVGELSPGVSPDVRTVIVDRSGGNPFYAEELVRLLRTSDRNTPGEWLAFESLPDSLQALLTARLDALDADHKAVLADAAVAGQVFSPELVAALGDRTPEDVRRMLGELSAREFVRPSPDDSPDAAGRFAFWHALTRDAAYSQLPRGTRAEKHAAAARWLESRMGDGPDDSAEAIAHHYVAAVDLLIEMGDEVAAGALRALSRAGDAALPLDVRRARDYYSSALSSLRLDDELRPHLMVSMAEVAIRLGDLDEAVQRLRRGITELEAAGDRRAAAIAMTRLSNALYWRDLGGMNEARLLREQAMDLLKADGPTPELVTVLEERAVQCSRDLEPAPAIAFADEAIAMSESLGLPMPIRALAYRGAARCDNGAEEGVEDLEVARRLAVQQRSLLVADSATQLLADAVYPFAGPDAGLAIAREAFTDASQRREHLTETWFQMQIVQFHRLSGRWDEALDAAVPLEALLDARGSLSPLHDLRWDIAQIRLHRGDLRSAERLLDWCMGQFGFHPFPRLGDLGAWIALCSQLGDTVGAREALAEYEELGRGRRYSGPIAMTLAQVLRAAVAIDAVDLAQALVADFTRARPLERAAMLVLEGLILEKSGDLRDASGTLARAASMWGAFGDPFEEALALRDAGRCLVELGSMGDAVATLRRASEILARLDAKPALSEVNSLLAPIEGDAASHRSASSTGAPEGRR